MRYPGSVGLFPSRFDSRHTLLVRIPFHEPISLCPLVLVNIGRTVGNCKKINRLLYHKGLASTPKNGKKTIVWPAPQ